MDKITQDFIKTSFGNILEWYDFTIYGLFAIQISKTFFPSDSRYLSLLLVFATFAVGFITRPIGSILFGLIGDRHGKHYAVNLSIWLMAIPTSLIGILPTYSSVGIVAPMLLIILRLCQGLSAGGQFSGLIAIAVDSDVKNKAYLTSWIYSISVFGCFIASFIGYLSVISISYLHSSSILINSLSWRVPFILSSLLFLIYFKLNPDFSSHYVESEPNFSLKNIIYQQPKELTATILLQLALGAIYYLLFSYLVTYLQLHLGLAKAKAFLIMSVILLLSIILYPLFGYYTKNLHCRLITARKLAIIFFGCILVFTFAVFNIWFGIISLVCMVILFCAIIAYTTSLFAEVFDAKYRMTACSISFNTGVTLAGFAPLIAELSSKISSLFGLPILLCLLCLILIYSISKLRQTKGYKNIKPITLGNEIIILKVNPNKIARHTN